jgi:hypothetical protein
VILDALQAITPSKIVVVAERAFFRVGGVHLESEARSARLVAPVSRKIAPVLDPNVSGPVLEVVRVVLVLPGITLLATGEVNASACTELQEQRGTGRAASLGQAPRGRLLETTGMRRRYAPPR